jgi:hypothetical protein
MEEWPGREALEAARRARELADIRARIEAERPALAERIERARITEIPAIQARIAADAPALHERIEKDRQARRREEERTRRATPGNPTSPLRSASEALGEAQSYVSIASSALGALAALSGRSHRRRKPR